MKKRFTIIIGVMMLIVIAALYLFGEYNPGISYDPSKAESIGINELSSFFKMCRNSHANPLNVYLCSSITDADLYKLEILKNIKGNKLCSFGNETECLIAQYASESKEIWRFEYSPALAGKIASYTIIIIESKENHFFIREGYTKDKIIVKRNIYLLEPLDKETVEIIAS